MNNQRGFVLTVTLFTVVALMLVTGASLLFANLNLRSTGALKNSVGTLQAADAGIQHALGIMPLGHVFSYATETTLLNSFSFETGYTYTVKVINDPASPGGDTRAILTSTASGPNGAKKVIVAYIKRGDFGLGATSLPGSLAENTETNFSGDTFSINGHDRCNAAPSVPAIAVTDPALATEIVNNTISDGGLSSDQMDNVIGPGGIHSVHSTPPPEKAVFQYVNDYLALDHTTLPGTTYGGNATWGTSSSPRITHVTGDVRISGTIQGYGVLVLDGALHVSGNFTFEGLVIMRGEGEIRATGNARIYGAVLIGESSSQDADAELDIRGTVNIQYDSCALGAAEGWVPLPKAPKIVAWQERFAN
ncbi:MAG: hypothetical protein HYV04_10110 [Deltaproteobacteria bacterium]|nr:hypothetical protein [Deltaproteobacteria bacterium]